MHKSSRNYRRGLDAECAREDAFPDRNLTKALRLCERRDPRHFATVLPSERLRHADARFAANLSSASVADAAEPQASHGRASKNLQCESTENASVHNTGLIALQQFPYTMLMRLRPSQIGGSKRFQQDTHPPRASKRLGLR